MTLYLIGLGLNDENDITLKGLEITKRVGKAYLEGYTSMLNCSKDDLEKLYGRKLIVADRELVERGEEILKNALNGDVALLVGGDPMSATTHTDLVLRAAKRGIKVEMVHNASVLTAVGVVGLELYKYGKTTSITFPQEGWEVETFYDVVKENKLRGLHTLCLLDIKIKEPSKEALKRGKEDAFERPRFMTIREGVKSLLDVERKRKENIFTEETICVGCARLGSSDMTIKAGKAKELMDTDFGKPLHCLIVPGKLHFVEEEALELWKKSQKAI